ncbi:photoreceptor outer segment membrane glycoprotein 2-like [Eublepharis macularius]|uniref:Photoreceptor outer segment membrane glycoprotein 2-like n=1 Tax=Eublepharis macularius TaxID=481883 RepID=A0AA97KP93_EUBMA|nr:photoreceptor outer segment membrane glycoprotein 2-like [Eublepharis macularius]
MAVLKVKFTKTKRDKLAQILWIFNWMSVVSGVILFSLGLFLKIEIRKRSELMAKGDITSAPNMLISVGVIACIINFLGGKICYDGTDTDKFNRWKLVILPYIVCTFCFTFYILGGAVLCYTMKNELEESLNLGLRDAIKFYKDTDIPGRCYLKKTIDILQIKFQCCGNNGFRDWFEIQWVSVRYLDMTSKEVLDRLKSNIDGKFLVDGVPFSCCNPNSPRPCIQYELTNNSAHYNYDFLTEDLNIWMKGCRAALLEYYTDIMKSIAVMVFLIWLFELFMLTGVRYLQTAMRNVVLTGDPQCDSDGWLFENSFVETAKYNINIIKNLGKVNQISTVTGTTDPNMDVQTASHGPENLPTKSIPKA